MRWEYDGIYYTTSADVQYESQVEEVYVCSTEEVPYEGIHNLSDYIPKSKYTGDIVIPPYIKIYGRKVPVTQVAEFAFYESEINSVKLPDTMVELGEQSFKRSHISSVNIPASLKKIGYCAFEETKSLKSIVIPSTVDIIESSAFEYSGVEHVEYLSSSDVGHSLFDGCENLTSITLSPDMKSIPEFMFSGCYNLRNIVIPDKVESIGLLAFYAMGNNVGVESITLGKSVRIIYYAAFHSVNIQKMTCLALVPPKFDFDNGTSNSPDDQPAFTWETFEDCILYVPAESVEAYENAKEWRRFNIQPIHTSAVDGLTASEKNFRISGNTISVDADAGIQVNIYSIDGVLRFKGRGAAEVELPSGMYILQMGSNSHRIRI